MLRKGQKKEINLELEIDFYFSAVSCPFFTYPMELRLRNLDAAIYTAKTRVGTLEFEEPRPGEDYLYVEAELEGFDYLENEIKERKREITTRWLEYVRNRFLKMDIRKIKETTEIIIEGGLTRKFSRTFEPSFPRLNPGEVLFVSTEKVQNVLGKIESPIVPVRAMDFRVYTKPWVRLIVRVGHGFINDLEKLKLESIRFT